MGAEAAPVTTAPGPGAASGGESRAAAFLCLAAALVMALLAAFPLERFPHSADEYAYQYQARTFLAGRVVNPPAPDPAAFAQTHIVGTPEGIYSKYPPGWPVVLAAGELLRVGHLVNPLLAGLLLWFAFRLTRRLAGARIAWTLLILLATNGFFLLNGAGYFSHPLAGLALVLGLDAIHRYAAGRRARHAALAGLWFGVILLARPQDALFLAPGFALAGATLLARGSGPSRLPHALLALVGPLLAAVALLLYNQATTGDPLLFGHLARDPSDRPGWNPLETVFAVVNRLQEYGILATAAFAALLIRPRRRGAATASSAVLPSDCVLGFAALLVALTWLGYSLYTQVDGPPRFGPRYLFPANALTFFLAAAGLVRALRPEALRPMLLMVAAVQIIQTGVMVHSAGKTIHAATGLQRTARALEEAIAPDRALVLVEGFAGSVPAHDLIRNDVDLAAPVLFARRIPEGMATNRIPYLWDGAGGEPILRALDPGATVQAVALAGTEATVLGAEPQQGWIVTSGSNRCSRFFWAFPGSRPTTWSAWGPCGECMVEAGFPAAFGAPWDHAGRRWFYALYRTFLRLDAPGDYAFRLRAEGTVRIRVDGRSLLDAVLTAADWAPQLSVFLEPGVHRVEIAYAAAGRPGLLEWSARGPEGEELAAWRYSTRRASPR